MRKSSEVKKKKPNDLRQEYLKEGEREGGKPNNNDDESKGSKDVRDRVTKEKAY